VRPHGTIFNSLEYIGTCETGEIVLAIKDEDSPGYIKILLNKEGRNAVQQNPRSIKIYLYPSNKRNLFKHAIGVILTEKNKKSKQEKDHYFILGYKLFINKKEVLKDLI